MLGTCGRGCSRSLPFVDVEVLAAIVESVVRFVLWLIERGEDGATGNAATRRAEATHPGVAPASSSSCRGCAGLRASGVSPFILASGTQPGTVTPPPGSPAHPGALGVSRRNPSLPGEARVGSHGPLSSGRWSERPLLGVPAHGRPLPWPAHSRGQGDQRRAPSCGATMARCQGGRERPQTAERAPDL